MQDWIGHSHSGFGDTGIELIYRESNDIAIAMIVILLIEQPKRKGL